MNVSIRVEAHPIRNSTTNGCNLLASQGSCCEDGRCGNHVRAVSPWSSIGAICKLAKCIVTPSMNDSRCIPGKGGALHDGYLRNALAGQGSKVADEYR